MESSSGSATKCTKCIKIKFLKLSQTRYIIKNINTNKGRKKHEEIYKNDDVNINN